MGERKVVVMVEKGRRRGQVRLELEKIVLLSARTVFYRKSIWTDAHVEFPVRSAEC